MWTLVPMFPALTWEISSDVSFIINKLGIGIMVLISVYVNHRPVFGLSPLQIGKAFKVLGDRREAEKFWSVSRNTLLSLLQDKGSYAILPIVYSVHPILNILLGEHLTEAELVEYLMTLLGHSNNPEVEGSFTQDVLTALKEIPERVSAPLFAEEVLGLSTQ